MATTPSASWSTRTSFASTGQTYSKAAEGAGHTPSRADWRIVRDWLVADTDDEARELALNGSLGRIFGSHNLPTFQQLGIASLLTATRSIPQRSPPSG